MSADQLIFECGNSDRGYMPIYTGNDVANREPVEAGTETGEPKSLRSHHNNQANTHPGAEGSVSFLCYVWGFHTYFNY